jgi:molybdopterin biosynthesis enzyme
VGWRSPAGKRQYVRAVFERRPDGVASARPVGGQGSHLVADLAQATGLVVVPEHVEQVEPGDSFELLPLGIGWAAP